MDPYSTQLLMLNQLDLLPRVFKEHFIAIFFALCMLLAGFILAWLTERIIPVLLRRLGWNAFCQWIKLTPILQKLRPDLTPTQMTGKILFYFLFLTFLMKSLALAKLGWLSDWGQAYFEFLPTCLRTLCIIVVASIVAHIIAFTIRLSVAQSWGGLSAELLRQLVLSLGWYIGLTTLGFSRDFILPAVLIVLAGQIVAFAWAWAQAGAQPFHEKIRVEDMEEGQ